MTKHRPYSILKLIHLGWSKILVKVAHTKVTKTFKSKIYVYLKEQKTELNSKNKILNFSLNMHFSIKKLFGLFTSLKKIDRK